MKKQLIPISKFKVPKKALENMFIQQLKFQNRFYKKELVENLFKRPVGKRLDCLNIMLTCVIQEACEARDWLDWKPWKKTKAKWSKNTRYEFINELVDIQHFLINAAIFVGCDSKEFIRTFFNKNKENINRQRKGY